MERRKRRQEASSGLPCSPSDILADSQCTTPIVWGSFLVSTQTATFPRPGRSRNHVLVLDPSSSTEAHRWKSATWAATPRQPTWLNDALSSRRSWATTRPTHWRACRPTPWSATRYRSIHISSNSPLAFAEGVIWLTWPPTRWNQPRGLHARGHPNHDHPQARTENVCSWRPLTRSRRPTPTSTASPATPRSRKNGFTPGSSEDRAHRRSTHAPPSSSDAVLCTGRTPSPSSTTDARGYAPPADSPNPVPALSPRQADVPWPPSKTAANDTWTGLTRYRPQEPSSRRTGGPHRLTPCSSPSLPSVPPAVPWSQWQARTTCGCRCSRSPITAGWAPSYCRYAARTQSASSLFRATSASCWHPSRTSRC